MADSKDFIPDEAFVPDADPMGQRQAEGFKQVGSAISSGLQASNNAFQQIAQPAIDKGTAITSALLKQTHPGISPENANALAQSIAANAQSGGMTVGGIRDVAGEASKIGSLVKTKSPYDVSKKALSKLDEALPGDAFKQGFQAADEYPNSKVILYKNKPVGSVAINDYNQVKAVETLPKLQGKGITSEAYKQIADELGVLRSDSTQSMAGEALWDSLKRKFPNDVRDAIDPITGSRMDYSVFQPGTNASALKKEMALLDEIRNTKNSYNDLRDATPVDEAIKAAQKKHSEAVAKDMVASNRLYQLHGTNYSEVLSGDLSSVPPEKLPAVKSAIADINSAKAMKNQAALDHEAALKLATEHPELKQISIKVKKLEEKLKKSLAISGNVLKTAAPIVGAGAVGAGMANSDNSNAQGYAKGGSVDFIPDSQFKPDGQATLASNAGGKGSPDFIPDSQFQSDEDKYGTTGQQLITGLEGAASAATFGLSTGVERALGVNPEDIRLRRETNPFSHGAGQVAGLVGSAILAPEFGAAKALGSAGAGVAEAVGLGAAESTAAKIGSAAVKGAVENMLFQGGDEVSKMLTSDPHQSVGTMAADIGLSGLLGGVISGGIGSISPLWEASFGGKSKAVLQDLSNETNHVLENGTHYELPPDYFQRKALEDSVLSQKPNANEISAAFEAEGLKPTAGSLSDKEIVQNMENNLSRSGTIPGNKQAAEYDAVWNKINKGGEEILRDRTNLTEAQVGKQIKAGVLDKINKELAPIEAKYKTLEPHFKAMEVPEKVKRLAIDPLLAMNDPVATDIARDINNLNNVNEAKILRTRINARISDAMKGFRSSEDLPALFEAKKSLTALRENAIKAASKSTGIGAKEAGQISQETIGQIRGADKEYRILKKNLQDLGREGGLGNLGSARQLVDKFSKLSDENLATRLFDINDINQLNHFKENYPKEFDLARRYKLKELFEKSINEGQGKNGRFEIGKLLRQVSDQKMNPEARDILFAGHHERLGNLKTIFEAIPGVANPSGTAAALRSYNLFTPQGLIDNASDAVKYAVLKRMPELMKVAGSNDAKAVTLGAMMYLKAGQIAEGGAFKATVDAISKTLKADTKLTKAAGAIFNAGKEVIPSKVLEKKDLEKLDKKLKDLQTNVQPLFQVGGKVASLMPAHGEAMAQTAMGAVNYLNSLRPSTDKKSPLDPEIVVSKGQKQDFLKALSIAENPMTVLESVKSGTITPVEIKHLNAIYPGLYTNMKSKIYSHMIEAVNDKRPIPYKTKLGVSMFLGQPLDSSMTPSSIQAAQGASQMGAVKEQAPQQAANKQGPHSMKDINKIASGYATPGQAREARHLKA